MSQESESVVDDPCDWENDTICEIEIDGGVNPMDVPQVVREYGNDIEECKQKARERAADSNIPEWSSTDPDDYDVRVTEVIRSGN